MKSELDMGMLTKQSNVREILIEMKSLAEICVDLAFASLLYSDKLVAEQVLVMEEEVDRLYKLLLDHLALSIKNPKQANQLRIYFTIGEANNIISDSAADMASLVLRGIEIEDEIKTVQQHIDPIVDLVPLASNSPLCGESELSSNLHDLLGVDIVGIIRPEKGFYTEYKEIMQPGDLLIIRGPLENINQVIKLAKGDITSIEEARINIINETEEINEEPLKYHQDLLVTMKQSAELLVDMSYLYALGDLPSVKSLIVTTEEKIDNLQFEVIEEVLRLYKSDLISKNTLLAYLRMADAFEEIADAAIKITFGVSAKHKPYTILEEIVEDSSEAIDYIYITRDSPYVNMTIKEAEAYGDFFQILAIRKKGKYFFQPNDNIIIKPGDGLIIKQYSSPEDPEPKEEERQS
ncbi:MAG: TrkA C-terminal domain-containing protein [Candidatus Heimdallarchaeaceae archaeon]